MKTDRRKYYLIYTLLFAVLCAGTFFWFPMYGRSLVRGGDGYYQHTKALAFLGKWLRDIVHTVFVRHSLDLPTYSLSMGYGADAVTTMHYYVLGDPLNLLAVFVPQEKTAILYECLIFVRMYLAGIVFSFFCFFHKKENQTAILAGSMLYVFSGYVMFAGVRHPYFINPMIWFPLILAGAEMVREKGRYALLAVSVCMAAISNFYFFYMIVILTVLYVLWRIFTIYRRGQLNKALVWIGKLFVGAGTGVLMSAFLFWPVVRLFLASSRGGADGSIYAMYRTSYYLTFPGSFMTFAGPGNWTHLGFTGVGMVAVLVLFLIRRKYTSLKAAFIFLMLLLLIPFGGYVLNGFIYTLNRWTWAVALLTAWILVVIWEKIFALDKRQLMGLCILLILLTGIIFLCVHYGRSDGVVQLAAAWALALLLCCTSLMPISQALGEKLLTVILCAGIILNGWLGYSSRWTGYALEFKTNEEMTRYLSPEEIRNGDNDTVRLARSNFLNTEAEAVAILEDADVVRYDGHSLTRNASVLTGMHSTQFYWSLGGENLDSFLQQMGNREYLGYSYNGLDDRTGLMTVSGVRYFYTPDGNWVPYGFDRIGEDVNPLDKAWPIYENKNALPLGFAYSGYIPSDEFDAADAVAREEMLLQAAALEDTRSVEELGIEKAQIETVSESLPYDIRIDTASNFGRNPEDIVEYLENGIRTYVNNVTLTLLCDGNEKSETSVYIKGLDYTDGKVPFGELSLRNKLWRIRHNQYGSEPVQLDFLISAGVSNQELSRSKKLTLYTDKHEWYNGRRDFVVNLGYREVPDGYIQIKFPYAGVYTWDSLEVVSTGMERIDAQTAALREDVLENIDLHPMGESGLTNLVTGNISLEKPKILFISIPNDSGWTAKVDGEKKEILLADNMFMALPLEAGDHQIELRYETPGMREGLLMTAAGMIILILLSIRRNKATKRETGQEALKK